VRLPPVPGGPAADLVLIESGQALVAWYFPRWPSGEFGDDPVDVGSIQLSCRQGELLRVAILDARGRGAAAGERVALPTSSQRHASLPRLSPNHAMTASLMTE
jgi:hypothetical protein